MFHSIKAIANFRWQLAPLDGNDVNKAGVYVKPHFNYCV